MSHRSIVAWMARRRQLLTVAIGAILAVISASCAVADDDTDPDGCTLVQSAEVPGLITAEYVDVRSQGGHPAPGESTCTWYAYEPGLTVDAPPVGILGLAYYHFASAANAEKQMRRLSAGVQSLDLVRTNDPQDEITRPDWGTVIARHDVNIAVVDASQTKALAREKANWSYRIEALALQAAGANVLGPVNNRATADTCHVLPPAHILALLTLSPSTLTSSLDGYRCYFSVEDRSGVNAPWIHNRGSGELTRKDFGSNAAALQFQHQQTPFFPASHLVVTADPTDKVVFDPKNPADLWAVHGPYYMTLWLSDATPAAQQHPSWAYRVQRAALEAAGATIITEPGIAPDPIVPGVAPEKQSGTQAWLPPPHAAPPDAAVMDPILHVLAIVTGARFFILPVFIGLPVVFSIWRSARAKKAGRTSRVGVWLIPLGVVFGVINLLLGTAVTTTLIYRYGVAGSAIVTDTYDTGSQYNNHDIFGHHVLIRTASQQVISADFEGDDFNVYPPHNETVYPGKGDEFTVRYLNHFPGDFVIVANDGSPWARGLLCDELARAVSAAAAKAEFAPDNTSYKEAHVRAVAAAQRAGCETD
jgi:hypothetical protein